MTAEDRAAHVEREAVAGVLHQAFHAAWAGPAEPLDLYATSSIWTAQADAVLAALPQTGDAAAVGTTVTEWGVRLRNGRILDQWYGAPMNRQEAETELAQWPKTSALISRQRTTFPDVLTDWTTAGADQ